MTLDENWLNDNGIKRILVYEKWPNRKGEIKRKKHFRYSYTDSLEYIFRGQDVKIYENDSLRIRCYKEKKLPDFCHIERIENGRIVKTENDFATNYMNYNSSDQLISIWYDHRPSIEGES